MLDELARGAQRKMDGCFASVLKITCILKLCRTLKIHLPYF